jgi:hypothetical protein
MVIIEPNPHSFEQALGKFHGACQVLGILVMIERQGLSGVLALSGMVIQPGGIGQSNFYRSRFHFIVAQYLGA